MDKSWINRPRLSDSYLEGVDQFLNFAFYNAEREGKILCPCVKCVTTFRRTREDVYDHLIGEGFLQGYTHWVFHRESMRATDNAPESSRSEDSKVHDDIHGFVHDAFGIPSHTDDGDTFWDDHRQSGEISNANAEKFYNFLNDADQEIYPGCQAFSKLSFVLHLYHLKCLGGWSNKSFTMLLDLLKKVLPPGEKLPKSFYESKKIIGELGLSYEKIDAFQNDCMLYWKEKATDSSCSICGASRYKTEDNHPEKNATSLGTKKLKDSKIPAKVLRYFPLKPRLQRLFMSSKTASDMTWHERERCKDGILRHPADTLAWKHLDTKYPDFSSDSLNVRLGLASDGFNPFGTMNINYSTWPVVLMPYNLPPWMCMMKENTMLSLLIPGPSAPGKENSPVLLVTRTPCLNGYI